MPKILVLPQFDHAYELWDDGRVWSNKRDRFLTPHVNSNGYLTIKLNNQNYPIHILLAKAFIPNPNNLETVNHRDKHKFNNSLDNLEWMSREDNVKHGLQREYSFLSPDGELFIIKGLNDFCKEMHLTQPNMSKVIAGIRPHHKGWTLA